MSIEADIQKLAQLEHEARTLEMLIQHISSMSEEDLENARPHILKQRQALESEALGILEPMTQVPVFLFDDNEFTLLGRFRYTLSKLSANSSALMCRLTGRQQGIFSAPQLASLFADSRGKGNSHL
jgi:hypothetical protein